GVVHQHFGANAYDRLALQCVAIRNAFQEDRHRPHVHNLYVDATREGLVTTRAEHVNKRALYEAHATHVVREISPWDFSEPKQENNEDDCRCEIDELQNVRCIHWWVLRSVSAISCAT